MLFREIVAMYCESEKAYIALCWQKNTEFLKIQMQVLKYNNRYS